ncbi:YolD-like family protein [Salicibibacter kimchii]|uniref:YolD-like family protein n=1 Tax=Salicibibacter kimchii TaxID=2099786 RepID=A0A345C0M5_9BACI|nr:YolD-like family protein [Salicibibacter kimchii]AXF56756.1 YolD-like family protein [Salicibibacter kimchii]
MRDNKLTPGSNMRWESLRVILPEHRERWLQHREGMKKVEKPELEEQKWEEFEQTIRESMEYGSFLEFTYWEDGTFMSGLDHASM